MRDDEFRAHFESKIRELGDGLYTKHIERISDLPLEGAMQVLETIGEASERSVLEKGLESGGYPSFDAVTIRLMRIMTLTATYDLWVRTRGVSEEEFSNQLKRLDEDKIAWVYEILPGLK